MVNRHRKHERNKYKTEISVLNAGGMQFIFSVFFFVFGGKYFNLQEKCAQNARRIDLMDQLTEMMLNNRRLSSAKEA